MPNAGFCDCHVHVVGDPARYPLVPGRSYTPGPAPLAALEGVARPLGVERFVIVQPSFYGIDNALMLESLDALGDRGRGVAVIDPEAPTDLDRMAGAGVTGLRMNLYSTASAQPGAALAEGFARQAAIARAYGWHIQVIAPLPVLTGAAEVLRGAPVPVVIDHYGLPDGPPDAPAGRAFLALLDHPHLWVKLSAPYRSGDALALRPDPAWLHALLAACPDRCVWGSDWPHTPAHASGADALVERPYRPLAYPDLLAGFRAALPEGVRAERILRDNPARLYGFTA